MKVDIKGIKFKYKRISDKEYDKKHNKDRKHDSVAHCCRDKKQLVFNTSDFSLAIVRHELMHAFFSSCLIHSCDEISMEDFEELACEIVEHHLSDIDRISRKIYKDLK